MMTAGSMSTTTPPPAFSRSRSGPTPNWTPALTGASVMDMDTTYTRTRTRYEQTIDAYVEIGLLPTDDEIPARWLARFDAYARRSDGGYVVASHRDGDVFVAALTES